jgi:peptidoglycan hydrolase-like protein with peptidoglycan-binding domain
MKDPTTGKWIGYGLSDTGPQVTEIQHRLLKAYPKNSQAVTLGVTESGTYDAATEQAVANIQPFFNLPATGIANYATEVALGAASPPPPPPPVYRPIWCYSAPGSGAPWWVGPPFEVGLWAKQVLNINHQPIGYPIGGYMGLLGGNPGLSYNDVIAAEGTELGRLLGINPDVEAAMAARANDPTAAVDVELWFTAYSQSADGMMVAVASLFGDGRPYELIRDRINGLELFGNPDRPPGDGPAPGSGISRKTFPAWLVALTHSITATSPGAPDFYAACDDEIRPLFYEVIVEANTSLSFFEHIVMIIIPVLLNFFAPFLGGLAGGAIAPVLALLTGLPAGLMGQAVTAANPDGEIDPTDAQVQAKLMALFTVQGIITNIPALIKLLGSLSGIQTHGSYDDPHPEFGGLTGVQVAQNAMASFRR